MTTAPAAQAAQQQGPLPNSGDSSRCSSGANLARRILTQYLVVRLAMIAISFWRDPVKAREQFPFVARFLGTPNTESEQQAEEQQGVGESESEDGVDDKSRKFREGETLYTNCLEVGDKIPLKFFQSSSEIFEEKNSLLVKELEFVYGSIEKISDINLELPKFTDPSQNTYLHIVLSSNRCHDHLIFTDSYKLNKKSVTLPKGKKLLASSSSENDKLSTDTKTDSKNSRVVEYLVPSELTVNYVIMEKQIKSNHMPAQAKLHMSFSSEKNLYYPLMFLNDFWLPKSKFNLINTSENHQIRLSIESMGMVPAVFYITQAMMSQQSSQMGLMMSVAQKQNQGDFDDNMDAFKEILFNTDPKLLVLSAIVTVLHFVFEILAFKSNIQFWNKKNAAENMSIRKMAFDLVQSAILLLYVMDTETNTMVTTSLFFGLGLEIWKLLKVFKVERSNAFPFVKIQVLAEYANKESNDHDKVAFKYVYYMLVPLAVAYCSYSLMYKNYTSWYSFVVHSAFNFLITYGFIMMLPQVFINYKLKSVAHMPWRMMCYKFLNTIIDDVFSFVVKTTTAYKIYCLRDDLVFVIFLIQKWMYPVDLKRENEFGTKGEDEVRKESA